jgi:hypothetical protein
VIDGVQGVDRAGPESEVGVGAAGIWGLHVWLWRHYPRGLFVNLHPDVTCAYNDM